MSNSELEKKYLTRDERFLLNEIRSIKHIQLTKKCSKCGELLTGVFDKHGNKTEEYCGYC